MALLTARTADEQLVVNEVTQRTAIDLMVHVAAQVGALPAQLQLAPVWSAFETKEMRVSRLTQPTVSMPLKLLSQ